MDIHSSKAKDKEVYMCRVIWKWLILYTMTLCTSTIRDRFSSFHKSDLPTNCYVSNSASRRVWEHASPGKCFKLGALRSNLAVFQTKCYEIYIFVLPIELYGSG